MNESDTTPSTRQMTALLRERLRELAMTPTELAELVEIPADVVDSVLSDRQPVRTGTLDDWATAIGLRFEISMEPNS